MRTKEQYRKMLMQLLPTGKAWPKETTFNLFSFIDALANEFFRVGNRVENFLLEADPRTTTEMLTDWETAMGIPDACTPASSTIQKRRADIVSRYTQLGNLNKQFYINFAAYLGFQITITEYRQFQVGLAHAGDPLSNGLWVYAFKVNAPANSINYFSVGQNQVGDALATSGNAALECAINKRKPAETIAIYTYGT